MYENILITLWELVEKFVAVVGSIWNWLSNPLVINITWLKIPLILPDGVNIVTGITPILFFGVGAVSILLLWAIKSLVPFL